MLVFWPNVWPNDQIQGSICSPCSPLRKPLPFYHIFNIISSNKEKFSVFIFFQFQNRHAIFSYLVHDLNWLNLEWPRINFFIMISPKDHINVNDRHRLGICENQYSSLFSHPVVCWCHPLSVALTDTIRRYSEVSRIPDYYSVSTLKHDIILILNSERKIKLCEVCMHISHSPLKC